MHAIEKMLRHLAREDVAEGAVATGRFPAVRIGDAWRATSEVALATDDILVQLTRLGGSRHVDGLSTAATQWQVRFPGVGVVTVMATRRGDDVRARFSVARREPPAAASQTIATPGPQPAPSRPASLELDSGDDFQIEPTRHGGPAGPTALRGEIDLDPPSSHDPAPLSARDGAREALDVRDRAASLMLDRDADSALFAGLGADTRRILGSGRVPLRGYDFDDLIAAAREGGASDLHVVADRPPLFRIAGELYPEGDPISPQKVEAMLLALVPARVREELARDGSCDFAIRHEKHGRARVNVVRQRTGYKGCFRLIPDEVPTLEKLGLPGDIAKATKHHQGLIVVTGPTGHGKTTTLAAIVDIINRETTHHVITVEDPIEYVHPRKRAMMSQREVGSHTKTFRSALKGSLREDPDVIVVGELRDTETMAMALAASETGHLVIGTMNTPSAAKTIDRIIDLFPPGDQAQVRLTLAGGLKLIVGQRLVPSVDRKRVHAAAELLPGTVALWNLIREEKTFQIPSLQQRGRALGIVRLDDSLAELVRAGKVSAQDAMAVAESPDTLAIAIKGGAAAMAGTAGIARPGAPPAPPAAEGEKKGGLFDRAGSLFGRKGGS